MFVSNSRGILDCIILKFAILSISRPVSWIISLATNRFQGRLGFTDKGILRVVNVEVFLSETSPRLSSKLSPKFNRSIVFFKAIYKQTTCNKLPTGNILSY